MSDEEKNTPPDEDTLAELRSQHGAIIEADAGGWYVVLAKPAKGLIGGIYQRFMEKMGNPSTRGSAFTGLFNTCVVYPDKDTVKRMLAEEPGLGVTFGQECTDLIGIREANVKKS